MLIYNRIPILTLSYICIVKFFTFPHLNTFKIDLYAWGEGHTLYMLLLETLPWLSAEFHLFPTSTSMLCILYSITFMSLKGTPYSFVVFALLTLALSECCAHEKRSLFLILIRSIIVEQQIVL